MMGFQFWLITAGIMVWPAHAFGLVPGGLAGTAILSILCFFVSFLKILKGDVPPRLHMAAAVGSIDECRRLLLSGLNPNSVDRHGRTALFHAILGGDIELVRLFMEFDTDPNISDKAGNASLHHVSSCSKEDRIASMVDALVEHGANLDKKNRYGLTPLEHARNLGRTAVINAIVSYDSLADPEVSEPDAPTERISE